MTLPTDAGGREVALLRAMLDAAIAAALPDRIVPAHLPPPPKGRTIVLGAGKASAAMAKAVEDHWPGELEGLVVTRYGHGVPCRRIGRVGAPAGSFVLRTPEVSIRTPVAALAEVYYDAIPRLMHTPADRG